jgi:drug/metabolite transporter (DMT)-like permease
VFGNLALWSAAAASALVGAAIVASRAIVGEVPPLTLALLRYGIALVCVLPFAVWAFRQPAVRAIPYRGRDLAFMAALGIGQFAILIALLNYGLQHVGAGQAALIFSMFPLLTLCLSAALGHERLTPTLLSGVLLSIAGVALSLAPKLGGAHAGHWWGELAVLASAGVGALCSVLYRPYLRIYPTLQVSALALLASVAFLALLAWPEGWMARTAALSVRAWSVIAFIGVSSAVGYFWWLYALKHETPTRVTVFLALNPVTAALLGALLLAEPLDAWAVCAICLIAGGLWLATRPARGEPR